MFFSSVLPSELQFEHILRSFLQPRCQVILIQQQRQELLPMRPSRPKHLHLLPLLLALEQQQLVEHL